MPDRDISGVLRDEVEETDEEEDSVGEFCVMDDG
jgi:hypothetical protein